MYLSWLVASGVLEYLTIGPRLIVVSERRGSRPPGVRLSMTLFPAKLDGGGESKVSLFHLVEVGRTQKLRVVTEAGEPDRLDTGVLNVNGGVEIAEKAGERCRYRRQWA